MGMKRKLYYQRRKLSWGGFFEIFCSQEIRNKFQEGISSVNALFHHYIHDNSIPPSEHKGKDKNFDVYFFFYYFLSHLLSKEWRKIAKNLYFLSHLNRDKLSYLIPFDLYSLNEPSNCLIKLLFPEFQFYDWHWKYPPFALWKTRETRRDFFLQLALEYNLNSFHHFYNITSQMIKSFGGSGMLHNKYNDVIHNAISSLFPHHDWKLWKFKQAGLSSFWRDCGNWRCFLSDLMMKMDVCSLIDGFSIFQKELIVKEGGGGMLRSSGANIHFIISFAFPEFSYSCEKSQTKGEIDFSGFFEKSFGVKIEENGGKEESWNIERLTQRFLFSLTKCLFPHDESLIEEYCESSLSLDIFLKSLNIAIEYQGEQHYFDALFFMQHFPHTMSNDLNKQLKCANLGISLITIP